MANPEHLDILKQGVEAWNQWREESNEAANPDLSNENFSMKGLPKINFKNTSLFQVNFRGANLVGANLFNANLTHAYLFDADFSGVDLSEAHLAETQFVRTNLFGATLNSAVLDETLFIGTRLVKVRGLENCIHLGPSTIDYRTLKRSEDLPLSFLRGCGLPDPLIKNLNKIFAGPAIQFYSCFISYSSTDQGFAERLYNDLQGKGVRCWYAPEDLKIGEKIRQTLHDSIRVYDKLLLILSEHSIRSPWVESEAEAALEKERKSGKIVLFPIRLDDGVMQTEAAWGAEVRKRHIGNFTNWKDHDAYQTSFDRLLRDLQGEPAPPTQ